jgi:photosystem II stability/assembly factor-like uncharacterized protein
MRSFILILFTVLLLNSIGYSQWSNLNPVPNGNDLCSVNFVNDSIGWVVGSSGIILKTTNTGEDWKNQTSNTTNNLKSVKFINDNTGWIAGNSGVVLKSSDGGFSWITQNSNTTQDLNSIFFIDSNHGWATGYQGVVLNTSDGGETWVSQEIDPSFILSSVYFSDPNTGWIVGKRTQVGALQDSAIILKTTNGGQNWIGQSHPLSTAYSSRLFSVQFTNSNQGWAVGGKNSGNNGNFIILQTNDGGINWNIQFNQFPYLSGMTNPLTTYEGVGFNSVYFKNATTGWAVGGGNEWQTYIVETTDAGNTWVDKHFVWEFQSPLYGIFVTNSGYGLATGGSGLMIASDNNGDSWAEQLSGTDYNINSIFFINKNEGWIGGKYLLASPFIMHTTNSGKTWNTQYTYSDFTGSVKNIYFINDQYGWATWPGYGLLKTTNGGNDWNYLSVFNISSVYFINENLGWGVYPTHNNFEDAIFKTTDGGITWSSKSTQSSTSIFFIDENIGWAVGDGGSILKSTDGGETWVTKSSGTTKDLNYIKFYNPNSGICIGNAGTILLSTDGGETWVPQNSGTTNDLNFGTFTSINNVRIVGDQGTILNTSDLGNNWNSYSGLTSDDLFSIYFIDGNTGWIGGKHSTIFNYATIPSLSLTSPNNGVVWKSGSIQNITWETTNLSNINLYYSVDNGTSWVSIISNINASDGNYNWTIPTLDSAIYSQCKIKIENASNQLVSDESNNTFIIWHPYVVVKNTTLGQQTVDFQEANIQLSINVSVIDNITVTYNQLEAPSEGSLPLEVIEISNYYWQISSTGINFSNGKIIVPVSKLGGVSDSSKLVWLKRSNPGDPWENIGGLIFDNNLESTAPFNSFSEFAIGSTDSLNPLPVELSSFTAVNKNNQIILKWRTETESNNYGFEIERKISDEWEKLSFIQGSGNSSSPKEYLFTDKSLIGGNKFQYRLKQIDFSGNFNYSKIIEADVVPDEFTLYQNYPNPFNPTTKIRYQIPHQSKVVIKIYNLLGSEVMELLNDQKEAGSYEVEFNGENLSSGTYIYQIIADNFNKTMKMVLLK